MAYTWKINGSTLTALGMRNLRLSFANMQADECSFDDPSTAFDANLRFAYGADIVVTWNAGLGGGDICIFRGSVAETPRFLGARAESIRYTALGRWRDLERFPFVQQFKIATTPSNPASTLSNLPLGLLILNQGDNGASALLSASLSYVVNSAIAAGAAITLGTVDTSLAFLVPWDEAVDLSCADALKRLLQLTPDVVCSWNYATNPPAVSFARRATLPAVNLSVAPAAGGGIGTAYAPLDSIQLTPLYHLQASGVCIIYVRTDRTDGTPWLLTGNDTYPPGTVPAQRDCITRTVKLTGATTVNTTLTQDVTTASIPATALAVSTALSAGIDPTDFASVDAFFEAHCPQLLRAGVTTKGYMNTYRAPASGDGGNAGSSTAPNSACVRELTAGSITDWMIADESIQVEEQNVHTDIAYSVITDPNTGATEYHWEHLTVKILATNASTGTYTELQDTSYTPPETAPAGLAQAIYNGVSQLHYDGTIELLGYDPAVTVGIGNTLNLTNSRAEWASMGALVQKVSLSVDDGRATVRVGWPRQLMPADLMSIWRANRTRKPVDDAGARNTGLSGNGTGDNTQSLGKVHKAPAAGAGGHIPPSTFTALLSPAGAVPVVTDMQAAVNTIYPLTAALATSRFPKSGDKIIFYKSGQSPCMIGEVTCQDPRGPSAGNTLFDFAFTANSVSGTWFLHAVQVGAYTP